LSIYLYSCAKVSKKCRVSLRVISSELKLSCIPRKTSLCKQLKRFYFSQYMILDPDHTQETRRINTKNNIYYILSINTFTSHNKTAHIQFWISVYYSIKS
jgi:hypothetical protein